MSPKDLRPILKGWPYEPGQITVRKVIGLDQSLKIQMRLDLGVLQMDTTGRPDGQRPHKRESYLHHQLRKLNEHERRNGTQLGFQLSPDECRELREEAILYYYRYLALFVLEDFDGVERDTARNLEVLDLSRQFAAEPYDRFVLEQYRPYILMMNTRAKAHKALRANTYRASLAHVDAGLKAIHDFFSSMGQESAYETSGEVRILRDLRQQIRDMMPGEPIDDLRNKLRRAIEEEQYEVAAKLRDEIRTLESTANTESAGGRKKNGGEP